MTDLKNPLTFVIIESNKIFGYQVLGTLLSIQFVYPTSNIVLSVCDETRNLINKFPIDMTCTIDYYDSSKVSNSNFNLIRRYLHNLYEISYYAVNKYERCLFVNECLLMMNKIEIPDNIEEIGFGFINKYFKGHSEETRNREYSFELIFMKNLTFINNLCDLIKEKYNIDISNINDAYREIDVEKYTNMPLDFLKKYGTSLFLAKQSLIATEDFCGFKDEIKLKEITNDYKYKDKIISFIGLRLYQPEPELQNMNRVILQHLTAFNNFIVPALTIKYFKERLIFNIPKQKAIGIWSRESCPLGLYQLIDYYVENYSEFFNKHEGTIEYFNICARILYDKPDILCLRQSMMMFGNIYHFNSDNQVKTELDKHVIIPNYFVFYHADFPTDLHDFRNNNDILTNKRSDDKLVVNKVIKNGKTRYPATGRRGMLYKTFMKLLHSHKYAHMKSHDFGLMMTLIGAGTIPILKNAPEKPFKLLEEGVHYLVAKPNAMPNAKPLSKKKYEAMRKNLNGFYEEHLHPEKTIRKLMHHLFIRDVE